MPRFEYPCPDCRTTSNLHAPDCRFDGVERVDVEKAYADVVAVLSTGARSEPDLREAVEGDWSGLHAAALSRLQGDRRVVEDEDDGEERLRLLGAAEYKERVTEPTSDPLKTIYEEGSVPGAHDNAVFALIAYYEMVGLTWAETREQVVDWLHESGTWRRGGFEEDTPEELVDAKRHVHEQGYGWKEKAKAARAVIERNVG